MSGKGHVVVTGASRGIGRELAEQLAARGHDLVLVSRSAPSLETLAAELTKRHGVSAVPLPDDLADAETPARIRDVLQYRGLAVSGLVNNAGIGALGAFAELEPERQADLLQVNVTSLVALTRLLLPGMIERGSGRVLNVASTAAFQPGPYMAAYYASKAFVLSFSEALAFELRGTGVTVTALCPGPTRSDFFRAAGFPDSRLVRRLQMDPARVARTGIKGMLKGRALVIPGLTNRLGAWAARLLPRGIVRGLVGRFQRRLRALDPDGDRPDDR